MEGLIYPYADILQAINNPITKLRDFLSFESKKFLFDQFNSHNIMSEKLPKTESEDTMNELEHFHKILKEHGEHQASNGDENTKQQSATSESCSLLNNLHDKKVNLVLVATSLEESDVVKKLKTALDPEKSSMIPLNFDDSSSSSADMGQSHETDTPGVVTYDYNPDSDNVRYTGTSKTRRNSEPIKDDKYWKRRSSNNEAAKKSRDAKKARFEWIEIRTKELEEENASLTKELDRLTKEVSDKKKQD